MQNRGIVSIVVAASRKGTRHVPGAGVDSEAKGPIDARREKGNNERRDGSRLRKRGEENPVGVRRCDEIGDGSGWNFGGDTLR